jgi:hypothetical protein
MVTLVCCDQYRDVILRRRRDVARWLTYVENGTREIWRGRNNVVEQGEGKVGAWTGFEQDLGLRQNKNVRVEPQEKHKEKGGRHSDERTAPSKVTQGD